MTARRRRLPACGGAAVQPDCHAPCCALSAPAAPVHHRHTTGHFGLHSLLDVINDVLDFSKIEAGKLDLHPTDFLLSPFMDHTLKPLAVRAREKGLHLAWRVRPDVPEALVGDSSRLRQVIVNLVGNAIKFTEAREVVVDETSNARRDR